MMYLCLAIVAVVSSLITLFFVQVGKCKPTRASGSLVERSADLSGEDSEETTVNADIGQNAYQRQVSFISKVANIMYIRYDAEKDTFFRLSEGMESIVHEIPIDLWFASIYPGDLPKTRTLLDIMRNHKKKNYHTEYRYKMPGDTLYKWFSIDVAAETLDTNGDYICLARDNTEWREQKSSLDAFYHDISYMSSIVGMDILRYDVMKETFVRLCNFGKYNNQTITIDNYLQAVYPDDMEKALGLLTFVREHKQKTFHEEFRYMAYDDEYRWFLVDMVASSSDDNDDILGYTCICRDNTQWHKEYEEMQHLRDRAEESNRLKTAFLANMSHEIRTPLNAIVGFSDLLSKTDNKEEKEEFNKMISHNNGVLLSLVNDILDLSRIESGSVELFKKPFSVLEFVEELEKTASFIPKEGVRVIFDKPYDDTINGDKFRIGQIVNNFITNACKFTKEGIIEINYTPIDNGICFSVVDTGIGISPENQTKIFKRFEKLNDFVQGTGLGLAISSSLATAMRGKVGVESIEGKGSTFWLWVPKE